MIRNSRDGYAAMRFLDIYGTTEKVNPAAVLTAALHRKCPKSGISGWSHATSKSNDPFGPFILNSWDMLRLWISVDYTYFPCYFPCYSMLFSAGMSPWLSQRCSTKERSLNCRWSDWGFTPTCTMDCCPAAQPAVIVILEEFVVTRWSRARPWIDTDWKDHGRFKTAKNTAIHRDKSKGLKFATYGDP